MIGDYDISRFIGKNLTIQGGSMGYMAPELVDGAAPSFKSDIYGLGCIVYYMMMGKHPFMNTNGSFNTRKQVIGEYEKIKTGKYGVGLINLVDRMMNVDPEQRPTPVEILKDLSILESLLCLYELDIKATMLMLKEETKNLKIKNEKEEKEVNNLNKEPEIAKISPSSSSVSSSYSSSSTSFNPLSTTNQKITFIPNESAKGVVIGENIVTFTRPEMYCIFIDKMLSKGICKLEAICTFPRGVDYIRIGIAAKALVNVLKEDNFYHFNSTSCIFGNDEGSYVCVGKDQSTSTYIPVPTKTKIGLEVNANKHTLDFFINDKQIPFHVINVPNDVYFGICGCGDHYAYKLTLLELSYSSIDKSLKCRDYVWDV